VAKLVTVVLISTHVVEVERWKAIHELVKLMRFLLVIHLRSRIWESKGGFVHERFEGSDGVFGVCGDSCV